MIVQCKSKCQVVEVFSLHSSENKTFEYFYDFKNSLYLHDNICGKIVEAKTENLCFKVNQIFQLSSIREEVGAETRKFKI